MRTLLLICVFASFSFLSVPAQGQFLKKLGDKVEKLNSGDTDTEPLPENYTLSLTGSGPDIYLEYQMIIDAGEASNYQMNANMKLYASPSNGGGRSEMNMKIPVLGDMSMVTLTNFDDPTQIILLNERKKQYSVMDVSETEREKSDQFTVTRLGEENLHGLQTTHVKAEDKEGHLFHLWTSKEVPGYEEMIKLYKKNQKMGSDGLWEALREAGADGVMVKMKFSMKDGSSVMEMTKMKKTTVPKEMLIVPEGYKQKKGGWAKRYMKQMQE